MIYLLISYQECKLIKEIVLKKKVKSILRLFQKEKEYIHTIELRLPSMPEVVNLSFFPGQRKVICLLFSVTYTFPHIRHICLRFPRYSPLWNQIPYPFQKCCFAPNFKITYFMYNISKII